MKRFFQRNIRSVHRALFRRELPDRLPFYFHSLERDKWDRFKELVDWLGENGRATFLGPDHWLGATGKVTMFSLDDDYRSWHTALPLLDKLAVKATFFVNTLPFRDRCGEADREAYFDRIEHEGDREALSTSELKELHAAGHTIGCHTHSHFCLAKLPHAQAQEEILRSKNALEDILQTEVADFSFPFGFRRHFTGRLRKWCGSVGLRTVFYATPGQLHRTPTPTRIDRQVWRFNRTLKENLENSSVDGRFFALLTGRNPTA